MRKKSLIFLIILLLVVPTGCGKKNKDIGTIKVQTAAVALESKLISSTLSGTLAPITESYVGFEVPGKITSLIKKEGDIVSQGEIIGYIDSSDYSAQVAKANAGVNQARAGLDQVEAGARVQEREQVKAQVDKAESVYSKRLEDFNRVSQLYENGAISKSDYENAKMALSIAESDLKSVKESYSLILEGSGDSVSDQAHAAYDMALSSKLQANLALSKTKLVSPISGTIITKMVTEGQIVNAGTPVFRIGNVDTLKIILPVADREISKWQKDDSVTVMLYDKQKQGIVTNINPAANMYSGTIGVEITIDNSQHDWFAGQVVTCIHKPANDELAILVPTQAVVNIGNQPPFVYLAVNQKAVKAPVTIGQIVGKKLEITAGLNVGNVIIVSGVDRINDGNSIDIGGSDK